MMMVNISTSNYVNLSRSTHDRLEKLEQRVGELNTDSDVKRIIIDTDKEVTESIENNTLAVEAISHRLELLNLPSSDLTNLSKLGIMPSFFALDIFYI